MTQELWGQILGFVATAVITSAYQANTKKGLLLIQTPGVVVLCVSYLLLGAMSGFALNIACVVRNVCCLFIKEKTRAYYVMTGALMCLIGALGFFSWEGWLSLLLISALVANTFFVALGRPQILRYSLMVTSSMCLVYNALLPIPSFGGILLEAITVASAIVGTVRFWKRKKMQAPIPKAV